MFFPAEKDYRYGLISMSTTLFIGLVLLLMGIWQGALTIGLILLFSAWIWCNAGYKINGTLLIIKYGPFRKIIPLEKVISIKELGSNKLIIVYEERKTVFVAPADKEKFLEQIDKLCPLLGIELQKK